MRALLAFGALLAAPVAAQTAAPAPPAPTDAVRIEALQQRLLASQQTVATLERELASAKNRAVVMEQCRVKNGRLVFIGRELIESYEKRYRMEHKDPLQLGRRRFEFELQALSDAVYTSRIDVPVPPPPGEKPTLGEKTAPETPPEARQAAPPAAPATTTPERAN